ncbi:MAG: carboxypeptidase-like regulatory domain-containing protein [Candidatus Kapabacteria bacterium]|nr:carboxypeptidase-like regulatory domain-containing protein [Candidatus Kapabacteria bacterium]
MRKFITGVSVFIIFIFFEHLYAQETLVVGHVLSKTDKSPLSAVNIYFKGTNTGVQSDEEGFYVIRNKGSESKLVFSCVGYKTQEISVRPGEVTGVEVALREDINILQELFVLPGTNPALLSLIHI